MSTEDPYEELKEKHGRLATLAWIGCGVYLFATTEGARFISWQAAVFFFLGMFVAAIVFGMASYGVVRVLSAILAWVLKDRSGRAATVLYMLGFVLLVVEAVIIFLVARLTLAALIGARMTRPS